MSKKPFTLENLRDDRACKTGLALVTPLIEAGEDVASALLDNCHDDWFRWALARGYGVESARRPWRTWDDEGFVYAISGNRGTSTSGNYGTSTSGNCGTSTSGDCGKSTSGYRGKSTSGNRGKSTSGNYGTSTSGNYGTSTSGDCGSASAGVGGMIVLGWHDGYRRSRVTVGYVGENGIKPDTMYRLNGEGEFEEVVDEHI